MKNYLLVIFMGMILFGCTSREYKCCEDNMPITNIRQAYVLRAVNEYNPIDSLYGEFVEYEIVILKEQAEKDRIAIESYALANEGRIYCCPECAEKAKLRILKQAVAVVE